MPSVAIRDLAVGKCKQLRKLLANQLAVIHYEDASFHGAFIRALASGLILVEPSGVTLFFLWSRRGFDAQSMRGCRCVS